MKILIEIRGKLLKINIEIEILNIFNDLLS